jgi:hypothetical protein
VANAHAAIGDGATSIRYAEQCLDLINKNPETVADWDYAFAYDCLSRAHAAAGHSDEASRIRELAREYGERIEDPEDNRVFQQWLGPA